MSPISTGLTWLTRYRRWLAGLLVGGMALVLGLAVLGFPDFLTRWILADANSGNYFIQAHEMHLDLGGGLNARNVTVYRKGLPGPPFLEARECRVLYHLFERPRAGRSRIKELTVSDGLLRPLWSASQPGLKNARGSSGKGTAPWHQEGAFRQIDLDVAFYNFDVMGVWVEQVRASVQVNAEGVSLPRLSGKIGRELHSGRIDGALAWRPEGTLRGRLATSFDPRALMPVCKVFYPEAVGELERFSFPTAPPRLELTFDIGSKPGLSVLARGRFQASNYAYRGAVIGFANINGEVVIGNGTNRLRLDPFSLTIGGRHAGGQVEFDFNSGTSDFQVRSEVSLSSVLRLVGMKESLLAPWNFEEGARLVAKGRIGYSCPEQSEVEARVEGAKIGYQGMTVSNYSFDYKNRGFTHSFSDFRGTIGGGFVGGAATMVSDQSGAHWSTDVKAEIINADTDELLQWVSTNPVWRVGGKLFGNLEIGGIGSNLVGQGQLTLRDARLLRSPLTSGWVQSWGGSSHGLDLSDLPAEARFSFALGDHHLTSQDLVIEAGPVEFAAKGGCGLDGSLNWQITPALSKNANARGRAAFSLLAPAWPGGYALTGTFEKPEWRPVAHFKKD